MSLGVSPCAAIRPSVIGVGIAPGTSVLTRMPSRPTSCATDSVMACMAALLAALVLIVLALAFGAHAVVDILHRPGALPVGVVPQWYLVGCAVYNVALGALCYLPLLRRG